MGKGIFPPVNQICSLALTSSIIKPEQIILTIQYGTVTCYFKRDEKLP